MVQRLKAPVPPLIFPMTSGMVSTGSGIAAVSHRKWCSSRGFRCGLTQRGEPVRSAYSITIPIPFLRSSSCGVPSIQTPGLFISTTAEIRSAVPSDSTSTGCGCGTGLPSSATTWNRWPGSASSMFSVALPFRMWNRTRSPSFYADRLAIAERLAVDAEALIPDLPSVGFGILVLFFPCGFFSAGRNVGVVHFLRGGEEGLPLVGGEKNFLIGLAGVGFGLDVDEAELPGVGSAIQIRHGHRVRMDEARAGWLGREAVTQMSVGGNGEAFLFGRAIDIGQHHQPVPVNKTGGIGIVEQVDRDGDAFPQSDQRTRNLPVVADGTNGVILRDVRQHRPDAQRYIGGSGGRAARLPWRTGCNLRGKRPLPPTAASRKAPSVCVSPTHWPQQHIAATFAEASGQKGRERSPPAAIADAALRDGFEPVPRGKEPSWSEDARILQNIAGRRAAQGC